MKLKIQEVMIETGGPYIVIINNQDAELLDLHNGDRVKVSNGKKSIVAKIDIATDSTFIKKGRLGILRETLQKLNLKNNSTVNLSLEAKPQSIKFIKKKLFGEKLSKKEIKSIIEDIVANRIDDIELSYFVAACHTRLMDEEEIVNLTKAMIETGDRLNFRREYVVDKHCVGGVAGNRTTMIIVPIVSAHGLLMPKTSSRSITSPAGTADTMECLANVSFSIEKIKRIIKKTKACIVWGGAINLAPADDRIIKVEHPLAIDSRSQLIASILAKKASVGATHVLVDIPVGKGSKIENAHQAVSLKEQFEHIGKKIGIKITCILTDGSHPIGRGFGPNLEARDVLYVLKNSPEAPSDLKHKSVLMAGRILEMTKKAKKGKGYQMALNTLESGKAFEQFRKIVMAQGIKTLSPSMLKAGRFRIEVNAGKTGLITEINNDFISRIARIAGAPRDKGAGILLHANKNDKICRKDLIFTIYSNNKQRLGFAREFLKNHQPFTIK